MKDWFQGPHQKFLEILRNNKPYEQGLKLSAISSLWQYYFGLRKPAKFLNLWDSIENQSAYLNEAI